MWWLCWDVDLKDVLFVVFVLYFDGWFWIGDVDFAIITTRPKSRVVVQ